MDNKSAQGKLARRLGRIGKEHGFQKIDGQYQRLANDVVQLFDQVRFWRQPDGVYTFDVDLKIFSPGFHQKVYGEIVNPVYHFQLSVSMLRLMGYTGGEAWTAATPETFSKNLDALEKKFADLALPFFEQLDSEAKVVEKCRTRGAFVRKVNGLAEWEVECYEGRSTLEQRPVPRMVHDPKYDKYLKGPDEFRAPILER